MASGWLVALALINAYVLFLVWLVRTGRMQKWNLSLMLGVVLMLRTQRGKGLLERLARPRRLWNAFGDVGTVLTLVGMAAMTVLMLFLLVPLLDPQSGVQPLAASEILVIPGVNPFVPLWYGIIALIVTLVVHEGGHGVLARANGLKVKSLGLLFAVVPVGAFVEPDEEELKATTRRNRLRVFAAGAFINLVVAAGLLALAGAMAAGMDPADGAGLGSITRDSPADAVGLRPGAIVVRADGSPVADWEGLSAFLDARRPGDTVALTLANGTIVRPTLVSFYSTLDGDERTRVLQHSPEARQLCSARYDPDPQTGQECAARMHEDAFLGVQPFPTDRAQDALAHPFSEGGNFLVYVTLPLYEVRGDSPILSALPLFYDGAFTGFFVAYNLVFWVFWINLMVGLTNILPMLPLDGGHIFRDAVGGLVARMRPRMDPQRRDRVVGRAAVAVSLVILIAFLLQIFGPRLSGLLA